MTRPARRLLAALAVLFLWTGAVAAADPTFPPLTGRVVDKANLLSPATEAQLTTKLEALETSTGRQLVVVTLPDLQGLEIEDYGYRLGRKWGIGEAKANTGAMLIVAPNQRAVRIEVGYGLEPFLTDALSRVILESAVLPKFRDGEMEAGVVAGTEELITQLSLPVAEARGRVRQAEQAPTPNREGGFPAWVIPLILIVGFLLLSRMGGRRRRSGLAGALPWILMSGAGRSWGGGGGGFSGGGGGGFSGGGGSFGGGGATGRW